MSLLSNYKIKFLIGSIYIACVLLFWNKHSQSPSWTYPFFSGAANLGLDLVWRIDASRYLNFEKLSYFNQLDYIFVRGSKSDLVPYNILDKGYVFIIFIAQNVLYFLPQIKAVIWFQILFHAFSSLWVVDNLPTKIQKIIFVLIYVLNPVIIHIVTFPYLYYWQVIPSLCWFYYRLNSNNMNLFRLLVIFMILSLSFLIRQSTLVISILILILIAWNYRRLMSWLVLFLFIAFAVYEKNPSQPWHTAYIGIGAYNNDIDIKLTDESAYQLFNNISGITINTTPPYGNYYDAKVRDKYYSLLKEYFLSYYRNHPFLFIRNGLLNILQGFSIGYPVGYLSFAYFSAFIGLIVLVVLLLKRMYMCIVLLLAGLAGFVAYYPPIPAYMFGNYFLLSIAVARIIDYTFKSRKLTLLDWVI